MGPQRALPAPAARSPAPSSAPSGSVGASRDLGVLQEFRDDSWPPPCLCPSPISRGSSDPDVVQVPRSNFQGSCAPSGLGRDLWIMDEQKRFMVVMCSKLVSNQLLRSPETERAEGRAAPFISPSPGSLGGCRVPTHCPKAVKSISRRIREVAALCRPKRGGHPHAIPAEGPLRASEHFLQSRTPHSPAKARVPPPLAIPCPPGDVQHDGGCGKSRLGEEHPCLHWVPRNPLQHPGRPPPRQQLLLRFEVTSCLLHLAVTLPRGALEPQRQWRQGWGCRSPCPALAELRKMAIIQSNDPPPSLHGL